jgi:flagellar biosynthesis protein FlhA
VGSHLVAGNYVIGLVVFFILVVVQFVVVTNGAQRVAEVAARFTLDSLPGKQMSIDADLNMGIINEHQAQERRQLVEKEANFYGAMDGATKFVKGDAVAGIIIILINIIGGLAIGVAQHGMPWQQALHVYTLQTVGDGIVTQVPSLIIAVATGIIITRAATHGNLADQLIQQVCTHPVTLLIVAGVISLAIFLPGLPVISLMAVAAAFFLLAYMSQRHKKQVQSQSVPPEQLPASSTSELQLWLPDVTAAAVVTAAENFQRFKQNFQRKSGLLLPELQLVSQSHLQAHQYQICIHHVVMASGQLYPDRHLVIDPQQQLQLPDAIAATEPAFGLSAWWLTAAQAEQANRQGFTRVDHPSLLLTHLTELVRGQAHEFVSRHFVDQLLEEQRQHNEQLVADVVPVLLAVADVQSILVQLVQERCPLHNFQLMLEVLADKARQQKEPAQLLEWVRLRLRNQLVEPLLDDKNTLHLASLAPALERQLMSAQLSASHGQALAIAASELEDLSHQLAGFVEKAMALKVEPVLLVNSAIRRGLWLSLHRMLPQLHVLSVQEIPSHIRLNSLLLIQLKKQAA